MQPKLKATAAAAATALVLAGAVWAYALRLGGRTQSAPGARPPLVESAASPGGNAVNVDSLRGEWVLVNFWDSRNAVSRIAAGEYDRYYRTHPHHGLRLLNINTDTDRRLLGQMVKADGLDSLTQFHITDVNARGLRPGYHPEGGYSSYLLDPDGRLVAVNPPVEQVEARLAARPAAATAGAKHLASAGH